MGAHTARRGQSPTSALADEVSGPYGSERTTGLAVESRDARNAAKELLFQRENADCAPNDTAASFYDVRWTPRAAEDTFRSNPAPAPDRNLVHRDDGLGGTTRIRP